MDVYEFDKCLLDRLEESMNVLSWKDELIPASGVRAEWSYFIELQIEPAGWQALWKIPRVICEELHVQYPTVVLGYVEQVHFKQLKAVFLVMAVQDDDVHLPERHEVALEDLWPTLSQENSELNVGVTADCIDRLRFFYTHVWMPWDYDNDDDLNWVEKHLESRIRFCYDLRKHNIKPPLATHIRTLLSEARYVQQRREYLELGLSDTEELDESCDKSQITDLMRLHLRLAMIRSEIEVLENPQMRRIYEEVKFDNEKCIKNVENIQRQQQEAGHIVYIVMLTNKLEKQIELMQLAQNLVSKSALVQIQPSLQNVLGIADASSNIFLSPGTHRIKFLEYLNGNGSFIGLTTALKSPHKESDSKYQVTIMSQDDDSILLVFDGDFTLENLVLDCQNVRMGIMVRNGNICLRNCRLIGDGKSSTQRGISCAHDAHVTLENCRIQNFATAIVLGEDTNLTLRQSKIRNCKVGLNVTGKRVRVVTEQTTISQAEKCGLYIESLVLPDIEAKTLILDEINALKQYLRSETSVTGDCHFKNCKRNVYIVNQAHALIAEKALADIVGDKELDKVCTSQDISVEDEDGVESLEF